MRGPLGRDRGATMLSYRDQGVFIGDRCGLGAVSCGFSWVVLLPCLVWFAGATLAQFCECF